MKEHGLYVIKEEYLEFINSIGENCDYTDGNKRPVYCCIKDNKIEGLYWAIPTSDLSHRTEEQVEKYKEYMEYPENDLRRSYYHIGRTTKEALYKVSSCYPVIDKYVDHAFTSCGKHVVIKRKETVGELEKKLKKILSFESRKPNYFPQHITDLKNYLLKELEEETNT